MPALLDPTPCPVCGFDGGTLPAADAAVAVRSFSRRYASLVAGPDPDKAAELAARAPSAEQWSAVQHIAHVADAMTLAADAVRHILTSDAPTIEVEPGAPAAPPLNEALDRLATTTVALAEASEHVPAAEWQRIGRLPTGHEVTAVAVLRHAVHVGTHHLRDVGRVLDEVRGRA